ncbi:MAG: hypothetical protein OEM82_12145 [Acidobacteriota bacterium]|nr:hypothetical protein [Acidobacteriota bacterium]MDH3529844.1 hypothetical protein [Acidobacteriota bacterium]
MTRQRSFFESDRVEQLQQPTRYRTSANKNEVHCGMCGDTYFLDDVSYKHVTRVIEVTLENPFLCEGCELENEESAAIH